MRTTTRTARLSAVAMSLALIVAACGDDDGVADDGPTNGNGNGETTEPTETTEAAEAVAPGTTKAEPTATEPWRSGWCSPSRASSVSWARP